MSDLAWAAGFFDGEGSLALTKSSVYLQVHQVNPTPLFKLHRLFGGREPQIEVQNGLGNKPVWKWHLSSGAAVRALKSLLPWLTVKRSAAIVALEFDQTIGRPRRRLTPDIISYRSYLRGRLKELNQAGGIIP